MKILINIFFLVFSIHLINAQNTNDKSVLLFITKTNDSIFLSNNDFILKNYESIKIISEIKVLHLKNKQINSAYLIDNDTIIPIFLCDLLASHCGIYDNYFISNKNKIIDNKNNLAFCSLPLFIRIQQITRKSLFD